MTMIYANPVSRGKIPHLLNGKVGLESLLLLVSIHTLVRTTISQLDWQLCEGSDLDCLLPAVSPRV